MNGQICAAIANRAVLKFEYKDHERLVEPHTHGISRKNNEVIRAYQVSVGSNSGEPPGWKMYTVQDIVSLRETGERFAGSREGYNPADSDMITVHCHV